MSLRLETAAGLLEATETALLGTETSDSGPILAASDELISGEELSSCDGVLSLANWPRVAGGGVLVWSVVANAVMVNTEAAKITVNKTMRNLWALLFAFIFIFKHILSNPKADGGLPIYRNQ